MDWRGLNLQKIAKMLLKFKLTKILPVVARVIGESNHFRGRTRIFTAFTDQLKLAPGYVKHHTGFSWKIDSLHAQQMFLYSCEPFSSRVLSHFCLNSQFFIDIGANRGWYSSLLRSQNSNLGIYAFEPDFKIYEILVENLSQFSQINYPICTEQIALGRDSGTVSLSTYVDGNDGMMTVFPRTTMKIKSTQLVRKDSIDGYFREVMYNFSPGKVLVKIDVEGSEFEVITGGSNFLDIFQPIIVMEINSQLLTSGGSSSLEIFELMESLEFTSFWLDERGVISKVRDKTVPPHEKLLGKENGANYLFLPKLLYTKLKSGEIGSEDNFKWRF